ncbi:ribosomal oxygenase 2-like [Rhopilema esculentum]|uniref:ribosomal oxygenase 2-like n=1 Tax=Rhopilema esculentum TaxID=499914 RepID=UPI0031DF2889
MLNIYFFSHLPSRLLVAFVLFFGKVTTMKRKGSSGEQTDTKGMKRRKREKRIDSDGTKKSTSSKKTSLEDLKTKLDLSTHAALMTSMLAPNTLLTFNEEHWEKKPLHIKRGDHDFYGNIFDKEKFTKVIESNKLSYDLDLNATKFVEGRKESVNDEDIVNAAEVKKLLDKKSANFQLLQPQRFSDPLWKIIELMEKHFGSNVGASFYVTPPSSQVFSPQQDDCEAFVFQLEGKEKWMLYKPQQELAREFDSDFSPSDLGEATHELELEAGDFLYFPRGTIHQAKAVSDGFSSHLMLSTYQTNSWGDFLLDGITTAVETAITSDVELRRGLPMDYLLKLGTAKYLDDYIDNSDEAEVNGKANGDEETKEKKKPKSPKKPSDEMVEKIKMKLKDLLCRVVDHFDPNTVADSRSEDFMANRLPPFDKIPEEENSEMPTEKSSIKLMYPDHVRLVVYEEDDDDEFDAEAADETDEEDIVGNDDDMDEDEEENEAEDKEEKTEKKAKGKGSKSKDTNDKSKEKKSKGKSKGKKSDTEDDEMEENGVDEDDDDDKEEDILQGPHIRLLFSVHNPRETHMISGLSEPNTVKLALHFAKPIKYLLDHCHEFVAVKDLPLAEDNDKRELASTLWTEKLISVK